MNKYKVWHIKKKLDTQLLKKGSRILEGTHDFSTYRSSACSAKSAIRKINSIKIKKNKEEILLTFKSKSFLQNQVRSMVGCLKYLSSKKWDMKHFKKVLKLKKRSLCPSCSSLWFVFKNVNINLITIHISSMN